MALRGASWGHVSESSTWIALLIVPAGAAGDGGAVARVGSSGAGGAHRAAGSGDGSARAVGACARRAPGVDGGWVALGAVGVCGAEGGRGGCVWWLRYRTFRTRLKCVTPPV